MSDAQETTILAEAGLRKLKELRAVLTRTGIKTQIVRPPSASNT